MYENQFKKLISCFAKNPLSDEILRNALENGYSNSKDYTVKFEDISSSTVSVKITHKKQIVLNLVGNKTFLVGLLYQLIRTTEERM